MSCLLVAAFLFGACGESAGTSPGISPAITGGASDAAPLLSEDALTEARAVRLRFGLRADDAFIRAVAIDPRAAGGIPELGIPLMPDELQDLQSRNWDGDLLLRMTRYGELFPEEFGGASVNLEASGVVATFSRNLERHRAAIADIVEDDEVVEVRQVRWSLVELDRFVAQIERQAGWFEQLGVTVDADRQPIANVVELSYRGPVGAQSEIERHFGDAPWLRVERDGPLPWAGPRGTIDLTVRNSDGLPVPGLLIHLTPADPEVDIGSALPFGTNEAGRFIHELLPAVSYRVTLLAVGADGPESDPVHTFDVTVKESGTVLNVEIPQP